MSKASKQSSPEHKAEIAAHQERHRAAGWVQVVIPGGHRRMMTRAELEAWRAER